MKKEKEYEVTIYCDGMEQNELATLTIVSTSPREAMQWVKDNMRMGAEAV